MIDYNDNPNINKFIPETNLTIFRKTLPVLVLSIFSFHGTSGFTSDQRHLMGTGQFLGAAGDFLLSTGSNGFLFGSLSFAGGHLMYLVSFLNFKSMVSHMLSRKSQLYSLCLGLFLAPLECIVDLCDCGVFNLYAID